MYLVYFGKDEYNKLLHTSFHRCSNLISTIETSLTHWLTHLNIYPFNLSNKSFFINSGILCWLID